MEAPGGREGEAPGPDSLEAAKAEVASVVEAVRAGTGEAREIEELPPTAEALVAKDLEQDISLKRTYAIALLYGLGAQVAVADGVFVAYAVLDWDISPAVMNVWLSSTVVEVVAVVLVVTRYLFPRRDTQL